MEHTVNILNVQMLYKAGGKSTRPKDITTFVSIFTLLIGENACMPILLILRFENC